MDRTNLPPPCFCPPNPDLVNRLANNEISTAAVHDDAQHVFATARARFSRLGNPTSTKLGLNDGAVLPPSMFPEGTSIGEMRKAALERAPLEGSIR